MRCHPILAGCTAFPGTKNCTVCICRSGIDNHCHQKKKVVQTSAKEEVIDSVVDTKKREKMRKQDKLELMRRVCELEELRLRMEQCDVTIDLSDSYKQFKQVCRWYNPILVIHLAEKLLEDEKRNLRGLQPHQLKPYFCGS